MKKGFTLIELLAIISILSILALIIIPLGLGIIDDAEEKAILSSSKFYIDGVEFSILNKKLDKIKINDGTYNILDDGNICLNYDADNKTCNEILEIEADGDRPTGGEITIVNGKVTDVNLTFQSGNVTQNNKGELVLSDINIPEPKSFAEDDWSTIVANVKSGNLSKYNVGDTKEIALTGFTNGEEGSNGLYTIRIANTSNTGDVCTKEYLEREDGTKEKYSKTACGFVIEFEDIILDSGDNAKMNLSSTNAGGWKDSKMRTYVNETIYDALPEELKKVIIETTVVSGYGKGDSPNKESTDKLYLLSTAEIWEQGISNIIDYDTARDVTRQLDYYKNYENTDGSIGVTTNNYSGAIKKYNGRARYWWLRSAHSNSASSFYIVLTRGVWSYDSAYYTDGVAVAFRIG